MPKANAHHLADVPHGSYRARQLWRWCRYYRQHHTVNRQAGTYHGYDSDTRIASDRDKRTQRMVERGPRATVGIGPFDPWPVLGAGAYYWLYWVAMDAHWARQGSIDGVLCGECLNTAGLSDVVLVAEHGDGYDEVHVCDHCGCLLTGDPESAEAA